MKQPFGRLSCDPIKRTIVWGREGRSGPPCPGAQERFAVTAILAAWLPTF